ncbi:MAG: LamG domain-containing protein, partial [Beijerinckiaceae bacterium]|nr:LamG domain-containing protein [Beijerinckiaceae bacterium]
FGKTIKRGTIATNAGGSSSETFTTAGGTIAAPAGPSDISIAWGGSYSGGSVVETAADNGTVTIATLTSNVAGVAFSEILDADSKFTLVDNSDGTAALRLSGILDYDLATSHSVTVRVTDAYSQTYDEIFSISVAIETDASFSNVALLMGGNEANNSQAFREGKEGYPWAFAGNAKNDTTQKKYGAGSLYFDGTGDFIWTTDGGIGTRLDFGSGDFTIEAWVRQDTGRTAGTIISKWYNVSSLAEWRLDIFANIVYFNFYDSTGTYQALLSSGSLTLTADGAFHHVAVSRVGNEWYLFVDGVLGQQVTASYTLIARATAEVHIGDSSLAVNPIKGWIDDLRVTKGVGRYSAAFTPPRRAFPRGAPDVNWCNQASNNTAATFTDVCAVVGDVLVVAMACDNTGTGGTSPAPVVADSAANTWTKRIDQRQSPGNVVDDGMTLHVWTTVVTNPLARGTISFTYGTTPTRKVAGYLQFAQVGEPRPTIGYKRGSAASGATATLSAGVLNVEQGNYIIGFSAVESNSSGNDSDTTNGSWVQTLTSASSNSGSAATSCYMSTSIKKVTATGDQEYNPSIGGAVDKCAGAIVIGI